VILGERAEEGVDRVPVPARGCRLVGVEDAALDRQFLVWRDDVDLVGLHLDRVRDFRDRHLGAAAEQRTQMALVGWVQMCRYDECEAAVRGHCPEQLLQRLEPAGRGADADDGKVSQSSPQ
jgi:hypothetical protein